MRLSPTVQKIKAQASQEAQGCGSSQIEPEHIVIAICRLAYAPYSDDKMTMDLLLVKHLFDAAGIRPADLAQQLQLSLRQGSKLPCCSTDGYSNQCKRIFEEAEFQAVEEGRSEVGIYHLLVSLFLVLDEGSPAKEVVQTHKGNWTHLLSQLKLSQNIPSATESGPIQPVSPAPRWTTGDTIMGIYKVMKFNRKANDQNPAIEGGMGQVYRVYHQDWNIDLVMKVPNQQMLQKVGVERFIQEAEKWVRLGLHPNLVACFYVRCLDKSGIPCIFTEYIDGGSLEQWIQSGKLYEEEPNKSLSRILDIAIQIASGLRYAHEQGLVHQDVKPANIMMTRHGEAKITDFGLARARIATTNEPSISDAKALEVTYAGLTWPYCSSEQARAHRLKREGKTEDELPTITDKTDTWSLGLSILAMLAGGPFWSPSSREQNPPPEHTGVEAAKHVQRFLISSPTTSRDDIRPLIERSGLAKLLDNCFHLKPDKRLPMYKIAEELRVIYHKVTEGQVYPRQEPKTVGLLADSWNNRALSYYDIGNLEQARGAWGEALKIDPQHPEATYNRGLCLWRSGQITDEDLVRELEEVCTSSKTTGHGDYLLGLVHMERGDAESAVKCFEMAANCDSLDRDVQQALGSAQEHRDDNKAGGRVWLVPAHELPVNSVVMSDDGRRAVSGSFDGPISKKPRYRTLKLWDIGSRKKIHDFSGYAHHIGFLTISKDGRFLLSAGRSGGVCLWDVDSGRCLKQLTRGGSAYGVAFTPDGKYALAATGKEVGIWEVQNGRLVGSLRGHEAIVTSVACATDGRVVTGSTDNTIRIWKLATRAADRILIGHKDDIRSVSISSDGSRVVSASSDSTLRVWDTKEGNCLGLLTGHAGDVLDVAMNPEGTIAVSGGQDCTVRLWDLNQYRCMRTFDNHKGAVYSVSLNPNGQLALSGSWDKMMCLWNFGDGVAQPFALCRPCFHGELDNTALEVDSLKEEAERELASGKTQGAYAALLKALSCKGYERDDELLDLWDQLWRHVRRVSLRDGWEAKVLKEHTREVLALTVSVDGRYLLTAGRDGNARLWEMPSGNCLKVFDVKTTWITSASITGDGAYVLLGGADNDIRFWKMEDKCPLILLKGHTEYVTSIALSPDGRLALSGSEDGTIRLWELPAGNCKQTLVGHKSNVSCVAISADGRIGLSGAEDNTIRVWDLYKAGRCIRIINSQKTSLAPSTPALKKAHYEGCELKHLPSVTSEAGKNEMFIKSRDLNLRRTELKIPGKARVLNFNSGDVLSLAVSPDSNFLAAGTDEGLVRLWRVNEGHCYDVFSGHKGRVSSVAFSSDSQFLLSGSWDGTVCLWSRTTGECIRGFHGHTEPVTSVAFTADGCFGISGSYDGTVRLWRLIWDYDLPGGASIQSGNLQRLPYVRPGEPLRLGDQRKVKSGLPLYQMIASKKQSSPQFFCKMCGKQVRQLAKFCTYCGASLLRVEGSIRKVNRYSHYAKPSERRRRRMRRSIKQNSEHLQVPLLSNQSLNTVRPSTDADAGRLVDRGNTFYTHRDFGQAEMLFNQAITLAEKQGDTRSLCRAINNLALVRERQGHKKKAEECYQRALTLAEQMGYQELIAKALTNFGVLRNRQGELDQAMEMQKRALGICETRRDLAGIGRCVGNIGEIHRARCEYDKAEEMFRRSLKIHEDLQDLAGVAACCMNLGNTYGSNKDCDRAMDFYKRALDIYDKVGNRFQAALCYENICAAARKAGNFKILAQYVEKAMEVGQQVGRLPHPWIQTVAGQKKKGIPPEVPMAAMDKIAGRLRSMLAKQGYVIRNCPKCGASALPETAYCKKCGEKL